METRNQSSPCNDTTAIKASAQEVSIHMALQALLLKRETPSNAREIADIILSEYEVKPLPRVALHPKRSQLEAVNATAGRVAYEKARMSVLLNNWTDSILASYVKRYDDAVMELVSAMNTVLASGE